MCCYSVKQGLMQALVNEQEKSVKTAIGQVIGILVRHEFPENGWPELMQFIQQMTLSENIQDKEVGGERFKTTIFTHPIK